MPCLGLRPAAGEFWVFFLFLHPLPCQEFVWEPLLTEWPPTDVSQFQPPPVPGKGGKRTLGASGGWRKTSLVCAHCSGEAQDSLCFLLFAWNLPKNPNQSCFAGYLSCFEGIFCLQRAPLKLLCDPVKKTNERKPSLLPLMGGIQASM